MNNKGDENGTVLSPKTHRSTAAPSSLPVGDCNTPLAYDKQIELITEAYKSSERIRSILDITMEIDRLNQLIVATDRYIKKVDLTELLNQRRALLKRLQIEMGSPSVFR